MSQLAQAFILLDREAVREEVGWRVGAGEDPLAILADCQAGMTLVGDRFQSGEFFLSELILSGEMFKDALAMLQPRLPDAGSLEPVGRVVLATVRGDVHDLGKNILAALLQAQGFEVHDLGVDVEPSAVLAKVQEVRPDLVGYSALITTAFPAMKEATDALAAAGLRDSLKVMVGGGATTPEVKRYVGADFQSLDAADGVAYCLKSVGVS